MAKHKHHRWRTLIETVATLLYAVAAVIIAIKTTAPPG